MACQPLWISRVIFFGNRRRETKETVQERKETGKHEEQKTEEQQKKFKNAPFPATVIYIDVYMEK